MSAVVRERLAWTLLAALITAAVLWWLLSEAVIAALLEALRRAPLWQLAMALLLVPVVQALRAWRFALLLRGRAGAPSLAMFAIATRLILLNFVLPFKLGELSFPVMMRQSFATPYARSAGILILARLLDLCVVASILMLGTAVAFEPAVAGWVRPALIAGGLIVLALPMLSIHALAVLHPPARRVPRLGHLLDLLISGTAAVRPLPRALLALAQSAAIWLAHSAIAWLVASALAPALPVAAVVVAGAASNAAFALPVNGIAGLGPPQAAWAGVLVWAGVSFETAAATALACHGVILIGVVLTGVATMLVPMRPRALPAAGSSGAGKT